MPIIKDDQLDSRIHSFLDRKLERFPEIANMHPGSINKSNDVDYSAQQN